MDKDYLTREKTEGELEEYIPISLLSEYCYCKRRLSLRLLETKGLVNDSIAKGTAYHSSVHEGRIEKRGDFVKITGMKIYSEELNLVGICDAVEGYMSRDGAEIGFLGSPYVIYPVEYKSGKQLSAVDYKVQLCAQAMCLEEMYATVIPSGYLYMAESNQKISVEFSDELRELVKACVSGVNKTISKELMHLPELKKACKHCSVYETCLPEKASVANYMKQLRNELYV